MADSFPIGHFSSGFTPTEGGDDDVVGVAATAAGHDGSGATSMSDFDPVADWEALSLPPRESGTGVWEHIYENSRRYHLYQDGRYLLPNDEIEQQREDMKHHMTLKIMDGCLFVSPIGDHAKKIIDIGTGTGIWAIEMGDKFPNAQILGTDLSPIQPDWIPENVRFVIDDCEADWINGSDWDFVHFRMMATVFYDPDRVMQKAFDNLKPGGWIELQELHPFPFCNDGTMKDDDVVLQFYDMIRQGVDMNGMNLDQARAMRGPLRRAGFANIQLIKKVVPLGPWHKEKTAKEIGLYLKQAVLDVLPSLLARPVRDLQISPLEQEVWLAQVRRAIEDPKVHRHFHFYIWYAQKPVS